METNLKYTIWKKAIILMFLSTYGRKCIGAFIELYFKEEGKMIFLFFVMFDDRIGWQAIYCDLWVLVVKPPVIIGSIVR